jgi:hypothetical protein
MKLPRAIVTTPFVIFRAWHTTSQYEESSIGQGKNQVSVDEVEKALL